MQEYYYFEVEPKDVTFNSQVKNNTLGGWKVVRKREKIGVVWKESGQTKVGKVARMVSE